jgi:hypothetical protein
MSCQRAQPLIHWIEDREEEEKRTVVELENARAAG